jgi:hypothetical protein
MLKRVGILLICSSLTVVLLGGTLAFILWRALWLARFAPEAEPMELATSTLAFLAPIAACAVLVGLLWKWYEETRPAQLLWEQHRDRLVALLHAGRGALFLEEATRAWGGIITDPGNLARARAVLKAGACRFAGRDRASRERYEHRGISKIYRQR